MYIQKSGIEGNTTLIISSRKYLLMKSVDQNEFTNISILFFRSIIIDLQKITTYIFKNSIHFFVLHILSLFGNFV